MSGTARVKSNFTLRDDKYRRGRMKRIPLIIVAGSLALVAARVAGANTSQTSSGEAVTHHQIPTSKLAQYQGSRQNNQNYQQYNKQDYSRRRSWGGG
jgi:hypothetical protein